MTYAVLRCTSVLVLVTVAPDVEAQELASGELPAVVQPGRSSSHTVGHVSAMTGALSLDSTGLCIIDAEGGPWTNVGFGLQVTSPCIEPDRVAPGLAPWTRFLLEPIAPYLWLGALAGARYSIEPQQSSAPLWAQVGLGSAPIGELVVHGGADVGISSVDTLYAAGVGLAFELGHGLCAGIRWCAVAPLRVLAQGGGRHGRDHGWTAGGGIGWRTGRLALAVTVTGGDEGARCVGSVTYRVGKPVEL